MILGLTILNQSRYDGNNLRLMYIRSDLSTNCPNGLAPSETNVHEIRFVKDRRVRLISCGTTWDQLAQD